MNKKYISIAIVSIVLLSVLFFYKRIIISSPYSHSLAKATSTVDEVNHASEDIRNKFIPHSLSIDKYNNLERSLWYRYVDLNPKLKDDFGIDYKEAVKLKYYDDKVVMFLVSTDKAGFYIDILDTDTFKKLNDKDLYALGQFIDSEDYIMNFYGNRLEYMKPGDMDFKVLTNSNLKNIETYSINEGPAGPEFDYKFNKDSKTLTISVYGVEKIGSTSKKLREVQFVLP